MSAKLLFGRDVQGYNAYAPYFSKDLYSATLAATTDTTLTVPSNFENWIVVFSYDDPTAKVWVALNNTAAAPAGATFASTNSDLRPASRLVKAGDVIHFFAQGTATPNVGVAFYAIS